GPVAAGEGDESLRAEEKVHLADGEVAELEAELGGDVRVRLLLEGEGDVESDADRPRVVRAAVRRLHHAGAAAGDDDVLAAPANLAGARHDPREPPRLGVPAALRDARPRGGEAIGGPRQLGLPQLGRRGLRVEEAGRSEDDDRRVDVLLVLNDLGLE